MSWDYDKTEYQKQAAADPVWHLERLINPPTFSRVLNLARRNLHCPSFLRFTRPHDIRKGGGINYGLGEEKLDRGLLEKHLPELNIPEDRRAFLELLIWNKKF